MDDPVSPVALNLPAMREVYGWLALDRRGNWLLRGGRISNSRITDYLARHYACDRDGRWYVQNGVQQVFVALEYTPFVLRAANSPTGELNLVAHDGRAPSAVRGAWLDDAGSLILDTDAGLGVLDDRDLDRVLASFRRTNGDALDEDELDEAIERVRRGEESGLMFSYRANVTPVKAIAAEDVPKAFGFVQQPATLRER